MNKLFSQEPLPLATFHELLDLLEHQFPGHEIKVGITRLMRIRDGNGELNFKLTLAKRTAPASL